MSSPTAIASSQNLDVGHRATRNLVDLANALSDLLAYRPGLVTYNPEGPVARLSFAQDFGPSAVAGAADLVATVYELMPKLRAARALSTSRIERWSEAAIEPGSSDGLTQRPG